ncbi:MAG: hypothetical protein ACXW0J_07410, partial [Nitrososphaeraceae archaeon]
PENKFKINHMLSKMNPVHPPAIQCWPQGETKGSDIGFCLLFILRYIHKRKRSGCSKIRIRYYFKWFILTEGQCISDGHIYCKVKFFPDFFVSFIGVKYKYKFKK